MSLSVNNIYAKNKLKKIHSVVLNEMKQHGRIVLKIINLLLQNKPRLSLDCKRQKEIYYLKIKFFNLIEIGFCNISYLIIDLNK